MNGAESTTWQHKTIKVPDYGDLFIQALCEKQSIEPLQALVCLLVHLVQNASKYESADSDITVQRVSLLHVCNDLYRLRTSRLYRRVSKRIVDPVLRQTSIDLWDNARLNGSYVTGSRVMYDLLSQDLYQKNLQRLDIIGVNSLSTEELKLLGIKDF